MERYKKCFVIAQSRSAALELAAGAERFAESVALVCLGEAVSAAGVDKVYAVRDKELSAAAYSGAVAALIKEQQPDLVLAERSRDGRLMAGIAAAALGAGVQTDPSEVLAGENGILTRKLSYGGLVELAEEGGRKAVVCVGPGIFEPAEEKDASGAEELDAASAGIEMVKKEEKQVQRTNLASARRVVGVGRGIKNAESLACVEKFAAALGAEMGCTRPVAEEDHLLPTSRYIGVSGVTVRPEVYFAVGLSGQVQHTAGCSQSGLIFAVNNDENAPIFKECDFGVIGELNNVIPKLIDALENK